MRIPSSLASDLSPAPPVTAPQGVSQAPRRSAWSPSLVLCSRGNLWLLWPQWSNRGGLGRSPRLCRSPLPHSSVLLKEPRGRLQPLWACGSSLRVTKGVPLETGDWMPALPFASCVPLVSEVSEAVAPHLVKDRGTGQLTGPRVRQKMEPAQHGRHPPFLVEPPRSQDLPQPAVDGPPGPGQRAPPPRTPRRSLKSQVTCRE